ncbi:heme exporter protein CcmB [Salinibius halmophilus]|uniref:heme exporter protein CcmB n=1 Tax=Salinibius halmophilus TaxID=1853216 RepID=UPI000E66B4EE|nr:heme exporter protein CcmB [Salinibius halmophilus]
MIALLIKREAALVVRTPQDWLNPLLFFFMVAVVFAVAIPAQSGLAAELAPGVLWVILLLALMLSLDSMFYADIRDGFVDQVLVGAVLPSLFVLLKILGHWVKIGWLAALFAPILAWAYGMSGIAVFILVLSVWFGSLTILAIGSLGAALTSQIGKGGLLTPLLVLPLYIPTLIFAISSVRYAAAGLPYLAPLLFTLVLALVAVVFMPAVTAFALKIVAE